jgi:hypothetical protein
VLHDAAGLGLDADGRAPALASLVHALYETTAWRLNGAVDSAMDLNSLHQVLFAVDAHRRRMSPTDKADPTRERHGMTESLPRTETPERLQELTAVLAQMGAVVLSAESIETTIELVATLAAATIPHSTGAGVTLVDARGQRSRAATDALVEAADTLQYQVDSGPCLTAWRDQVTVRVDDTAEDERWPSGRPQSLNWVFGPCPASPS